VVRWGEADGLGRCRVRWRELVRVSKKAVAWVTVCGDAVKVQRLKVNFV